jgi:crotonobetainyl-CoA:carnitine CoA-transferase CaiB-like acyl-CoA transferase
VREWLDEFERRGVPSGPLNTFADILGDPELTTSELVQDMRVPVAGSTKTVAYPVRLNGRRTRAQRPPPRLGEHRDEVLAEWLGASVSSERA